MTIDDLDSVECDPVQVINCHPSSLRLIHCEQSSQTRNALSTWSIRPKRQLSQNKLALRLLKASRALQASEAPLDEGFPL